jgi:hypothetical protein
VHLLVKLFQPVPQSGVIAANKVHLFARGPFRCWPQNIETLVAKSQAYGFGH